MTAKELFLKSNDAKVIAQLFDSVSFQVATEAALIEFQDRICTGSNDVSTAAANHFRLEGARSVISILKRIAKPDQIAEKIPIGQLKQL